MSPVPEDPFHDQPQETCTPVLCVLPWFKLRGVLAGGSALAQKLVDIYFTLFKLILEGKLGHASELAAAREEKAQHAQRKRPGRKPPAGRARPDKKKAPSSADQVSPILLSPTHSMPSMPPWHGAG